MNQAHRMNRLYNIQVIQLFIPLLNRYLLI
nr:MAG TPA: hypothetical protein [Caudoviricetes sp.]